MNDDDKICAAAVLTDGASLCINNHQGCGTVFVQMRPSPFVSMCFLPRQPPDEGVRP